MTRTSLLLALPVLLIASAAQAQRGRTQNPFDDQSPPPNTQYQGSQGFSFPGDELPPSHDLKRPRGYDERYSQTYKQQQEEAAKSGGCLKYGSVGALGGYAAGHSVLGALAGCATGAYIRHRNKERVQQESGRQ